MAKPFWYQGDCLLSGCGRYRYLLTRSWDAGLPECCWIMLNPSTADATDDDNTIRRILGFCQDWGFGGFKVVNLFAWRATHPEELRQAEDPVGPDNNRVIAPATSGRRVFVAWGEHGRYQRRDAEVLEILRLLDKEPECLGYTKAGNPWHPLRVRRHIDPIPYRPELRP